jgi:hypothetical protein
VVPQSCPGSVRRPCGRCAGSQDRRVSLWSGNIALRLTRQPARGSGLFVLPALRSTGPVRSGGTCVGRGR